MPIIAALIVAAGRGTRAGGADAGPKQYAVVGGATVLEHTLAAFLAAPLVTLVQVVIHPDDRNRYDRTAAPFAAPALLAPVAGGASRQASVRAGLTALAAHAPDLVLIHDAARPFVDRATIARVIAALDRHAGAIAAVPLADTLKRADGAGCIAETIERAGLWLAQTPQGFRFADIRRAHTHAAAHGRDDFTDDAALAEYAGLAVALVPGSAANCKLTTREDLAMAADRLHRTAIAPVPDIRTGQGFDVHRFAPGDHVWLCGVRIAHDASLEGHSDADVGLHALTDALLGAIGDGDIGAHFANTDPAWRGAPSHLFLADALARVGRRGGRIANVDVTLLCEAPKIAPHRDAMRRRIAEILALDLGRVGVKATTTEGLGFTGRREGIAALAIATVVFQGPDANP